MCIGVKKDIEECMGRDSMAKTRRKRKLHMWAAELAILLGLTVAIGYYISQKGDDEQSKGEAKSQQVAGEVLMDLSGCEAGQILSQKQIGTEDLSIYFTAEPISDDVFLRMNGKSYQDNPNITREELRYLKVLHYNFNHQIQVGELVVNQGIAQDCLDIFRELYDKQYEINSMYLVDRYYNGTEPKNDTNSEAADYNSINDNNTSCFNYRLVAGTEVMSAHSLGLSVDINPLQNPSVAPDEDGQLSNKYKDIQVYADRSRLKPHMIVKGDDCYNAFIKRGFIWGGEWNGPADYQHFEKRITK